MVNITLNILAFANPCQNTDFFGLVPWYNYLPSSDFYQNASYDKFGRIIHAKCDVLNFSFTGGHSDVLLVLLAVADDLLRIAGIVAVAFVVIGAFQFITSQGNGEQAAAARNTIINALIGTAFAAVAVGVVSFLGSQLGG